MIQKLHHPQKAHQILIEASNLLVAKGHNNFHVLLVGDGDRKDELRQLVESKGLSKHIHFLGLRQDIPELLLQCDSFLLSSDYEGLSLAILEGMAAGLPIVATKVGGNPQLIQDGVSGYLVPPQVPDSLADAMQKVMDDKKSSINMGKKGRSIVEETYSIETVAIQTVELFETCMSAK